MYPLEKKASGKNGKSYLSVILFRETIEKKNKLNPNKLPQGVGNIFRFYIQYCFTFPLNLFQSPPNPLKAEGQSRWIFYHFGNIKLQ